MMGNAPRAERYRAACIYANTSTLFKGVINVAKRKKPGEDLGGEKPVGLQPMALASYPLRWCHKRLKGPGGNEL
jgi:hypothetical protein